VIKLNLPKRGGVNWHPARIVGRASILVKKNLDYLWQPFLNIFDKQGEWVVSTKIACFGSVKTNHPVKATTLFHWSILIGVAFAVANPFQMFKQLQLEQLRFYKLTLFDLNKYSGRRLMWSWIMLSHLTRPGGPNHLNY